MPSILTARREWLFLGLSLIAVSLFVLRSEALDTIGFPLDDAWIHQTYARNLADSGEWAFVPDKASAASTAPLYSALLSIGHLLGLSPFIWVFVLGVLALTLAGSMAAQIGEQLFPNTRYAGIGTGLAVVMTWHLVWAAASGMETMLFTALSLTVIWMTFRELDLQMNGVWIRSLALGVISGLLTLTRPEGIVLIGLLGLGMLATFGTDNPRRYLYWAVGVGVGWLVVVAPYALWNYDLTGELLPSTADAKIAEYAPLRETSLPSRYFRLLLPVLVGAQFLLLPGLVAGLMMLWRRFREDKKSILLLVPAVWAFVHLTTYTLRLPANYQHGRYMMPILPPLLLYSVGGMVYLVERARYNILGRIITRTLALSAVVAFPAFLWIGSQAYASDVRIINTEMVATAKWIHDNPDIIPPDELLAVHDIGAVGYYTQRDILDLAGLVSPEVVPIISDDEALMALMCEKDVRWLMAFPDQRPAPADDPRLSVVYESPYNFADLAAGKRDELWKMRVYALRCNLDG